MHWAHLQHLRLYKRQYRYFSLFRVVSRVFHYHNSHVGRKDHPGYCFRDCICICKCICDCVFAGFKDCWHSWVIVIAIVAATTSVLVACCHCRPLIDVSALKTLSNGVHKEPTPLFGSGVQFAKGIGFCTEKYEQAKWETEDGETAQAADMRHQHFIWQSNFVCRKPRGNKKTIPNDLTMNSAAKSPWK